MALTTFTAAYKQTSDAEFRAWGKAVSDALQATSGVTKTTDTGQVDWTTVAKPAAGNTKQGYEVYRFSDALHSGGYPVFIRIDYGSGAAATSPAVWITIGPSTDGAGTITGLNIAASQVPMGGASTAAGASRISADTNRLLVALATDHSTANAGLLFSVERTHDASGTDTNEGLLFIYSSTTAGNAKQQAYSFSGGAGTLETLLGAMLPTFGTGATGTAIALYPVFLSKGVYYNPSANVLIAFAANVTAGVQISFTFYGATRKFMPQDNYICAGRGKTTGLAWVLRDE